MITFKNCFVTLLVIVICAFTGHSQNINDEPVEKYKFGIGIGAGFATGYGLSFRYQPQKFGVQINFAPYKTEQTERYSTGLTFIYNIIESKITNLYIYQANHYLYHSYNEYIFNPAFPDNTEEVRRTDSYVNNGLGFGIEVILAKRIGLNLMTGYAFYNNFKEVNVTGEVALYYKF